MTGGDCWMKVRKVPMRMCVGCREMKPKRELLRIVRTPQGQIVVDRSSKASGRGAYICAQQPCLDKAIRIKSLDRALEHHIEPQVYEQLSKELLRRELL